MPLVSCKATRTLNDRNQTITISPFTRKVIDIIKNIPRRKVATYRQVADLAGNRFATRQVVWILNSQSNCHKLPWHRVINSQGKIGLTGEGYKIQKKLLLQEGVVFDDKGKVNFREFLWKPQRRETNDRKETI